MYSRHCIEESKLLIWLFFWPLWNQTKRGKKSSLSCSVVVVQSLYIALRSCQSISCRSFSFPIVVNVFGDFFLPSSDFCASHTKNSRWLELYSLEFECDPHNTRAVCIYVLPLLCLSLSLFLSPVSGWEGTHFYWNVNFSAVDI